MKVRDSIPQHMAYSEQCFLLYRCTNPFFLVISENQQWCTGNTKWLRVKEMDMKQRQVKCGTMQVSGLRLKYQKKQLEKTSSLHPVRIRLDDIATVIGEAIPRRCE